MHVMATLPDRQSRGRRRATVNRIVQEANATNTELAFLTTSPFCYPFYRPFGFEHIFDCRIYHPKDAAQGRTCNT